MMKSNVVTWLAALAIASSTLTLSTGADAATIQWWTNCTALHNRLAHAKHGLGRLHAVDHVTSGTPVTNFRRSNRLFRIAMSHNQGLDRDKDKVACEAH